MANNLNSCNLTLLFGFGQAVACAEAGVTLISPFVGRVSLLHQPACQNPSDHLCRSSTGTRRLTPTPLTTPRLTPEFSPSEKSTSESSFYTSHSFLLNFFSSYYKQHGYKTIVMGASFRNTGEIAALAGCDFLTISPKLLDELNKSQDNLPKKLDASSTGEPIPKTSYLNDEAKFRWELFDDVMAFDKLHEGIRGFAKDGATLKNTLIEKLKA